MAEDITPSNSMVEDPTQSELGPMTGDDILQKAMETIDTKLVTNTVVQQAPVVRFKAPSVNAATLQPKPKTVLTVQQLMAGLSKGNIRLASPTATTPDQKQLPIAQILRMAQAQKSQVQNAQKKVVKVQKAAVKRSTRKRRATQPTVDDDEPLSSAIKRRRKRQALQNASLKKSKLKPRQLPPQPLPPPAPPSTTTSTAQPESIGLEYTDLTEPPEGYICVFMPIKQKVGEMKPILVPGGKDTGLLSKLRATAVLPTITAVEEEEEETEVEQSEEDEAIPESLYCVTCAVYYSVHMADVHADCARKTRPKRNTQMAPAAPDADDDVGDEDLDDVDRDVDFVMEVDDDDDEDDDYRPKSGPKRRTRSDTKDTVTTETTTCDVCKKPNKNSKDHINCTQSAKATKSNAKQTSCPKSPEKKEPPKCSVCSKPYTSYDEHIACSGARKQNERNLKDGQQRSVEIQRVKRRRRVHRFLRLNFTLNPQIADPPTREFVGSHLVKDEDDLLEENFTGGDERPPLGLTCYVCSSPFEDDISAYHHYTQSKCGPKYIGKVLFRSKNRAENRPNNVMVEKSEQGERPKLGQRLKRNYYNAFKEKIVTEDGTAKKDHICTACGESFANQEAVKEHYSREHRWRCRLCGDIYVHMKGVQLHYNRSHGKSYCVLCHVLFDSATELQVHMRTHQKRLCDLCGQVLANKHHYNKHMLKQHNVANAEPLHNEIVKTKPQPRGLCEICGKEYSWPFLKTKHMASHFNPKPPKPKKPKEEEEEGELEDDPSKRHKNSMYPFRCDICSRGFQRVFYFNQHLERHAKGLACQKCGLFFAPPVDRQKHLAECMENICADCGEQCATKEALKRHKQTHPGQEVCKICHRQFATKFLLKNHAQTHRQYQCKVCSKRFPSMDHVNKHKCFGKKFQCKVCGEKFSSIKQSKQHAKTQHNRDGMDIFTKRRVEFDMPDEEFVMSAAMTMPMRVGHASNTVVNSTLASIPPLPGPSHIVAPPIPPAQPSMTAHEVSQALMTLHDFPMTGYSPMPINMARDGRETCQRDPNNTGLSTVAGGQLCRDGNATFKIQTSGANFRAPPNHPPPGYPGAYF